MTITSFLCRPMACELHKISIMNFMAMDCFPELFVYFGTIQPQGGMHLVKMYDSTLFKTTSISQKYVMDLDKQRL